jgi:enolase
VAKYSRLLTIEEELGQLGGYAGIDAFKDLSNRSVKE